MYLDRFEEDYPTHSTNNDIHGFVLAEDSELELEIIEPSFSKRNLGFFDPVRGEYLITPEWA